MEQVFKHTDVFLTHTWRRDLHGRDNHERVKIINEQLCRLGYSCWFDEQKMTGNIQGKMAEGIDFTGCVLMFVTEEYMKKIDSDGEDNCKFEFERALMQKTKEKILVLVMENEYTNPGKWFGKLKEHLSDCLYVSMTGNLNDKQYLKTQLQLVVKQLQAKGVNPSLLKKKCIGCMVMSKNGNKHPFYTDGTFCTVCAENLQQTIEAKNYCKDCNRHESFNFCSNCKAHLLDKSKQINELMEQFIKIMTLDSTTDVTKNCVQEFEEKIDVMKEKLYELQLTRNELKTSDTSLEIDDKEYKSKFEAIETNIEDALKVSTSAAMSAEVSLKIIQPTYEKGLLNLEDTMYDLQSMRDEFDQEVENISRARETLQKLNEQVLEFSDGAVKVAHYHGKDCVCLKCSFDRDFTAQMITSGPQYLQSLITENDVERVKLAMELKKEILDLKDKEHNVNLLMSLTLRYGTAEMFTMLIESAIDVDSAEMISQLKSDFGKDFFRKIITNNSIEDINKIIALREDTLYAKDENGFNLFLSLTVQHGSMEMFNMLLAKGLDVDKVNQRRETLLHYINKVEIMKWMCLQHGGVLLPIKNNDGCTALMRAYIDDNARLVEVMLPFVHAEEEEIRASEKLKPLYSEGFIHIEHLISKDYVVRMKKLLLLRSNVVQMVDKHNRTPLLRCSISGSLNMLKLLLDHGSDANHCDKHGKNTLHYVLSNYHGESMARYTLTKFPHLINLGDNLGNTPLLLCSKYGSLRRLKLLLDLGSDVNHCNKTGKTALFCAVGNKDDGESIVNHLCEKFPHLMTIESNEGYSVFHWALILNVDIVSILLRHSPTPGMLLKKGMFDESPLDMAKRNRNKTIVRMFEDYLREHSHITTTIGSQ